MLKSNVYVTFINCCGPISGAEEQTEYEEDDMALTRDFRETILARAQREPRFRHALFTEAIDAYLAGDTATGKAMLRDLVNATIGFEGLALEINKPSKSLHRMLAPRGNPSSENFFGIVSALQKTTRVKLSVTAKHA
jgi:hypothetical protein